MTLGQVFLESMSTGVITRQEMAWVAASQHTFSRAEEAAAIRLGRLVDEGQINLGCRLAQQPLQHQIVLEEWIEPLGRRLHR
ncbi:MAG: hypothetical protein DBW85_05775 [Synechococcus sp. MED-G71]|nr:MAG: hypothetical protein DBW85_05775 [Synechococcus sp. MED-G71]|tara:strand:- start:2542 stop:2787 length:246 start_codon:yes stop_codon:yes gene_type:complete